MAANPLLPVAPSGVPLVELRPPFRKGDPPRVVNRPEWIQWYNRMRVLLAPEGGPYQLSAEKDQASGYLGLDTNARFAATKIADGTVSNTEFLLLNGRSGTLIDTANLLTQMLAVDGAGSLLDADKLDGNEAAAFLLLAATSLAGAGFFLDEDTMSSDSATKVASQQSIKAYVDAQVAAASGGSRIPISTQTVSGGVGSVSVESGIDGTYGLYLWEWVGLTVDTDDVGMRLTVGDSGGYKSTTYKWSFRRTDSNAGNVAGSSNSDAHIELVDEGFVGSSLGNGAGECAFFRVWITQPSSTANYKIIAFESGYNSAGASAQLYSLRGDGDWHGDVTALTKLKLTPESGNIDGGVGTLYGFTTS